MNAGVLWQAEPGGRWQYRSSLCGRTYPKGSVFVTVLAVSDSQPIPPDQYAAPGHTRQADTASGAERPGAVS